MLALVGYEFLKQVLTHLTYRKDTGKGKLPSYIKHDFRLYFKTYAWLCCKSVWFLYETYMSAEYGDDKCLLYLGHTFVTKLV